jgi:hypothetical protein
MQQMNAAGKKDPFFFCERVQREISLDNRSSCSVGIRLCAMGFTCFWHLSSENLAVDSNVAGSCPNASLVP